MSYANDKLYTGYVRRKMAHIVNNVKVREIVPHLSCLTISDREEIEAKKESSGNWTAMQYLLDCLRRRENWPEHFIAALEECEHTSMAAEIRAEYNALKGLNQSNPPSTVVKAHVHPAPAANQPLSFPENVVNSQAVITSPPLVAAEPANQALPLPGDHVPPNPEPPLNQASPKSSKPHPEFALQTPESHEARVVCPPRTPPPSPEIPPRHTNSPPPPQGGDPAFQESVENFEIDLQVVSSIQAQIHDEASSASGDVPPEPESAEPCETAASSELESTLTTTITGSVSTIMISVKLPVQDTAPPTDTVTAAVLQPEENSEPATAQVPVCHIPPVTAVGANVGNPAVSEEDDVCISKPGPLISIQPNNVQPLSASDSEVEPYSGNTDRLEQSDSISEPESTAQESQVTQCSPVAPGPATTTSYLPNQENGIQNHPEENHYESVLESSLGEQEVLVHVVQVTEEPYLQNQHGQSPSMRGNFNPMSHISVHGAPSVSLNSSYHSCEDDRDTEQVVGSNEGPQAQTLNGQASNSLTKEPTNATGFTTLVLNPSSENFKPEVHPEAKIQPSTCTLSSKYLLVAAGVGACALLVAWKLKH